MEQIDKLIIFSTCAGYKKRASYWKNIDFDKFDYFWIKHQAIYNLIVDLGLLEEYKHALKENNIK